MSEKSWADGLASGAFKNKGRQTKKKQRGRRFLRQGVRRKRMVARGLRKV